MAIGNANILQCFHNLFASFEQYLSQTFGSVSQTIPFPSLCSFAHQIKRSLNIYPAAQQIYKIIKTKALWMFVLLLHHSFIPFDFILVVFRLVTFCTLYHLQVYRCLVSRVGAASWCKENVKISWIVSTFWLWMITQNSQKCTISHKTNPTAVSRQYSFKHFVWTWLASQNSKCNKNRFRFYS